MNEFKNPLLALGLSLALFSVLQVLHALLGIGIPNGMLLIGFVVFLILIPLFRSKKNGRGRSHSDNDEK
jgi:hypothetical protein